MNYNDFKLRCENTAKKFDVNVDVKLHDMSRYGREDWFQAAFEVDHFGGIAAIVSFFEDNLWYDAEGVHKIFTRWEEMEEWIVYDIAMERAARENVEMINCD